MKLYQFAYSAYAIKVRKCLELKGLAFEPIEVPYLDRRGLLAVTGGSISVPVLDDGGEIVTDSPRITAYLDQRYPRSLREDPLAEVIESWSDSVLEDTAFRLAVPALDGRLAAHNGGREDARALWRFTKERKFGPGCIEAWRDAERELWAKLAALTDPLARVLSSRPFLLGPKPTLADAAVYGILCMLDWPQPGRIGIQLPALADWYERVERAR